MRRLLVILLLLITPASGQASPQTLVDETATWLSRTLITPVPTQQVTRADYVQHEWIARSSDATGQARIEAVPWLVREWSLPKARRPLMRPAAGHVLIHELLHLHRATVLEEGAVDAVALDLLPAWSSRFIGTTLLLQGYGVGNADAVYPADVRLVRALSAAGTGHPHDSRPARLWRRQLLLADDAGRTAMVTAANARAAR